ncbi:MAG: N-acetylglucosamine-6-phosphate deacetylase [Pyrinomonadaceae bacterium]|nr:N-acetylglucosamine-6-phosphate deacetylase [Pyrinomonadaceae bacterium]
MGTTLLKNARLVLENEICEGIDVLLKNGLVAEISNESEIPDEIIDLESLRLLPGFIDIHNHGAVGFDVNESSTDDLVEIARFLASKGVTAWLPTLVPDSDENYRRTIGSIDRLMEKQDNLPIAQALGVHYEGVFANERMCGALRPEFFKSFKNSNELSKLPRLKTGIHFTTLAPEVENGIALVEKLVDQNWIVSIGHTKADTKLLDEAHSAGARHLTHFFNAMTGLHHRNMGVVGWALTKNAATFDIIADGIHVDPKMLKFAVEAKTVDRVSLISDSVLPTGLGDGDYEIWGGKISVSGGKTQNEKGSIAGSVITMLDAFRMMKSVGFSDSEVSKMASLNPAKLLGVENSCGSIETGKRADLVVLDENENLKMTFVGGVLTGA